jgi:hypothetical protein
LTPSHKDGVEALRGLLQELCGLLSELRLSVVEILIVGQLLLREQASSPQVVALLLKLGALGLDLPGTIERRPAWAWINVPPDGIVATGFACFMVPSV